MLHCIVVQVLFRLPLYLPSHTHSALLLYKAFSSDRQTGVVEPNHSSAIASTDLSLPAMLSLLVMKPNGVQP